MKCLANIFAKFSPSENNHVYSTYYSLFLGFRLGLPVALKVDPSAHTKDGDEDDGKDDAEDDPGGQVAFIRMIPAVVEAVTLQSLGDTPTVCTLKLILLTTGTCGRRIYYTLLLH